jgi:hypothetical protein
VKIAAALAILAAVPTVDGSFLQNNGSLELLDG